MLKTELEELLIVANDAVDLAVEVMRSAHGPGVLTAKGDRDYATALDYEIEQRVRDHLAKLTPTIEFLGEEEGASGAPGGRRWALDPIDGTVNYVHGLPLHAISLALVSDDQPVVGVIDLPALGARYRAAEGLGAYKGRDRLPCPPPPPDLASAVVAVGDYAVGVNADEKNRARLDVAARLAATVLRVRMLGSAAIDLAWLAEGHLDVSITLSNNTWDMAAGVVIARETGHQVVDDESGPYTVRSTATIAAHAEILSDLLGHLADRAPR